MKSNPSPRDRERQTMRRTWEFPSASHRSKSELNADSPGRLQRTHGRCWVRRRVMPTAFAATDGVAHSWGRMSIRPKTELAL